MNRPERRHAVTPELRAQILEALQAGEADPAVRAIILTGSGGHFSGGGDIERISGLTAADIPSYMEGLRRFVTGARQLLKAARCGRAGRRGRRRRRICACVPTSS